MLAETKLLKPCQNGYKQTAEKQKERRDHQRNQTHVKKLGGHLLKTFFHLPEG